MFLLPSIGIGVVFAVLLGGRLSRVLDVKLRCQLLVVLALGLQIALFSALGDHLSESQHRALHLGSYVLLIGFAVLNLRVWALVPVLIGTGLNALAIAANGGRMPVADHAAHATGLPVPEGTNVTTASDRLGFLGDVFALPAELPLANVFSVGDVFIGFGMAAFIVAAALSRSGERALWPSRMVEPFRVRAYARLAAGRFASQVGDWLTLAALIGWVYSSTGSTLHVAGLLLVRLAPPILGGGIATLVVDRLPKQRLLVWVEVCRGIAVLCALAGVLADDRMLVFVAFACSGALAAISGAIVPALVPSLLPVAQLASANAGLGMAKDAGMALGALGAGVALASVGPAAALSVDALTFVAAFFLFRGVAVPDAVSEADAERDARVTDWATVASTLERLGEWRDAASAWGRSAEFSQLSGAPDAAEAWATAACASEKVGAWEDAARAWNRCADARDGSSAVLAAEAWERSASAWSHAAMQDFAAAAWERRLAAEARAEEKPSEREVAEIGEGAMAGLRYLLRRRPVFLLISSFAVATLATGLTNATLPGFLESEQDLGSGGYGFGIAALATGLLLGEAMVGFSRVGDTAGRWIGAGLMVMAALFVVLALTVHAPTALLVLALIGLVDGTTDVLFETIIQRETDPRYLGCVFGFASAFVSATMTGAFAVAPIMGELFDGSGVIMAAGVCLLGASVIAFAATVRLGLTSLAPAPASSY
jgi:hypothetical protein